MVRPRTTVQPGLFLQPFVLNQLVGRLLESVVAPSGLVGGEYAVASWLNVCGQATPTELAADLGMKPTTITSVVDRLVRKGQVRRRPNPEDGRSYLLELTARGKATNARNAERFDDVMRRVLANLEGDRETILEQMRVLEAALRKTVPE